MRIAAGEVVQIHGPNGSGKTTLLRVLCGLQPAVEGHIRWRGTPVPPGAPELRAEIQYIGHAGGVKLDLTPRENLDVAIALGAGATGVSPSAALARLGIGESQNVPLRALSAGQRQRVALARLLTCRCTLWILDEPFTALDTHGVVIVRRNAAGTRRGRRRRRDHQPPSGCARRGDPQAGAYRSGRMSAFTAIVRRDLTLAVRYLAEAANPLLFFLIVVALVPLGLSPRREMLEFIAPGVFWIAALLATLLSLERMFRDGLRRRFARVDADQSRSRFRSSCWRRSWRTG